MNGCSRKQLGLALILAALLGIGTAFAGSPQFLWKPVSESDGNLVILFPSQYRLDNVARIVVADGKEKPTRIDQSGANGDRIHARIRKPGAFFGKNVTVALHLKNGAVVTWKVPNGADRFTRDGAGKTEAAGSESSSLGDVLGTGAPAAGKGLRLDGTNSGRRSVTLPSDGPIIAKVCLRTFSPSSLSVKVNGSTWIEWSRHNDSDSSPCYADGKVVSESIYEEKLGDPSAREVTLKRDGKAGEVVEMELSASEAECYIELSLPGGHDSNAPAPTATGDSASLTPVHDDAGLYKPESKLWLLPRGIAADSVLWAGEIDENGTVVKYFRLGGNAEPLADGKQAAKNEDGMYHPPHRTLGGVKMRNAKATRNGAIFVAHGRDGRLLARKVIKNRTDRQE